MQNLLLKTSTVPSAHMGEADRLLWASCIHTITGSFCSRKEVPTAYLHVADQNNLRPTYMHFTVNFLCNCIGSVPNLVTLGTARLHKYLTGYFEWYFNLNVTDYRGNHEEVGSTT